MSALRAYYSSHIFQINSHVPMIYYEPCNIKKIIFSTPNKITTSKHEKLNNSYTCCHLC